MNVLIDDIQVLPLKAPLLQPFRIAVGEHQTLDNLLLKLCLSNGVVAFGEAAVASHITGETVAVTRQNLSKAAEKLRGNSLADYLRASAWLHEAFGDNKAAVAAVEMAWMDALTQTLKIPLWKMYGRKAHLLKTDITIVIASLEQTRLKVKEFYRQGFRSFKVKIGRDMDLDFHRVHTVQQLAPRAQIILDANQGFNASETLKFLKSLDKAGISVSLIEQPVAKKDLEGLKRVKRLSKIPVCADESASSLQEALGLIRLKAVDAINIKLMKTGLFHAYEIIRLAKANGLQLMIGGMMESNVAMTAAAHLASGVGGIDYVDLDTPFFIDGEARRNPYLSDNGVYDLSQARFGLGLKPSNR